MFTSISKILHVKQENDSKIELDKEEAEKVDTISHKRIFIMKLTHNPSTYLHIYLLKNRVNGKT